VTPNLKHLCMFQVLFYGCLRASELCNLDDDDLDLEKERVAVRAMASLRMNVSDT
jgi:integrase